jgi:hypothetical protein
LGGSQFSASLGKKVTNTPVSTNKPGIGVHACNPSYSGGIGRRITVQGQPQAKILELLSEK